MTSSSIAYAALVLGCVAIASSSLPAPSTAQSITGRDLKVVRIAGYEGVVPDSVTLRFSADGTYTGFGGCNRFMGRYSAVGATLRLDPPGGSFKLCAATVMFFEDVLMAALRDAASVVRLNGSRIELVGAGGLALIVLE